MRKIFFVCIKNPLPKLGRGTGNIQHIRCCVLLIQIHEMLDRPFDFSTRFTLRTYTHVTRQMQESAAEKMGNFMAQVM